MLKRNFLPIILLLMPVVVFAQAETRIDPDALVVTRGDAEIRMRHVDARVARIPPEDRAGFMDSPSRIETLLTSLLTHAQLAHHARELGLHEAPGFEDELHLFANEILARRFLEHVEARELAGNVDEIAREMYMTNPSVGLVPERREVSHVLVQTEARTDQEALALINEIRARIKLNPEDFEAIARSSSEDPSVQNNGGRLGPVGDEFVEEFREGAERLSHPGDISEPVRTPFGYHIIRLDALTPSRRHAFEDILPSLRVQVRQMHTQQLRRRELDKLQLEPIEADPDAVASLRTRYMPSREEAVSGSD
jgi:hypothetical protein